MITTQDFRTGLTVEMDGDLWQIAEYQHVKPGKGGAFVRTKFRKLKDGSVIERTFRVGEKFVDAYIEKRDLQFLYKSGEDYHFMDLKSYEQLALPEKTVGPGAGFLKENMEAEGQFYKEKLIGLDLPVFVELRIESTEPGIKGDTSKAANKPATLETGKVINVPLFIDIGDTIKIDTRTGSYVSRA